MCAGGRLFGYNWPTMMQDLLRNNLRELAELLPRLAELQDDLAAVGQAMLDCWQRGGKVLTCGNGGSAADAMHLAEELVVRFCRDRRGLAAVSLCEGSVLTCCGNDYGYAQVFARQVEALGNPGDILVVFTTSGNSENVLRAIGRAREQKMTTVAFLGKDGGKARGLCDIELMVPSDLTHHVQEAHQILYHCLCQWIDEKVQ